MLGPTEDDCLIIRSFFTNIYINNTMYLQSMMNRRQSFSDHPMISCPKTRHWQGNNSRRSVIPKKLLLCLFIKVTLWHGYPHLLQISRICLKTLLKRNTSKGLLPIHLQLTHRLSETKNISDHVPTFSVSQNCSEKTNLRKCYCIKKRH